ncbi:MAG: HEAT repeat domain-containing protein, partial [Candidatus Acidiferrales bacterium]
SIPRVPVRVPEPLVASPFVNGLAIGDDGTPSRIALGASDGLSITLPEDFDDQDDAAKTKAKGKQKTKERIKDEDADDEQHDREEARKDREEARYDREEELYDDGTDALDEAHWDKARDKFDQVVEMNLSHADAALYWKAYAENKLGRRADALATLNILRQKFPQSRWLNDAKALDLEVRQSSGQTPHPENQSDEDLKLLALNGAMQMECTEAVPMLEKFMHGNGSPKLKARALFVLAQGGCQQARDVIDKIARGQSNPELQRKAIEYLGLFGGKGSRQTLSDIYSSSNEIDVKRQILRSFMISGDKDRVLAAAKNEKVPELRREAIRQLGVMGAQNELWQLYQTEPVEENKEAILQAMFVGGSSDRLLEIARTEKNPELRRKAIRNLGLMGTKTGDVLVDIYAKDSEFADKREVLNALFLEGNAHAIVAIARKETNPDLKKVAVEKLALMHSKEATEYMMEILNK